jgi:hypothetical protein
VAGAIVVFPIGYGGSDVGHVAYVESVSADGSRMTIREDNWNGVQTQTGTPRTERTGGWQYIYHRGETVNGPGPAVSSTRKPGGDFNGDGKSDVAWYDQGDGGRIVGLMSNGSIFSEWRVLAGAANGQGALGRPDWAGVGDFNGDGKSDVAWYDQGDGGRIVGLMSNGSIFSEWRVLAGAANGQGALGRPDWAGPGSFP